MWWHFYASFDCGWNQTKLHDTCGVCILISKMLIALVVFRLVAVPSSTLEWVLWTIIWGLLWENIRDYKVVYASSTQQIITELKFDLSGGVFCVGRAGRYGSKFLEGAVTCLDKEDLPLLHNSLTDLTHPLEVMNNTCMRLHQTTKDWFCCLNVSPWLKKWALKTKYLRVLVGHSSPCYEERNDMYLWSILIDMSRSLL
jgi:hypothetical protein